MTEKKHTFRNSAFERRNLEQYFTEHWATKCLMQYVPQDLKKRLVWDPCAGRGDILEVCQEYGFDTVAGDIDTSNWNHDLGSIQEQDFMSIVPSLDLADEVGAIITNPPYGGRMPFGGKSVTSAEAVLRHSLTLGMDYVAMLLRTDFNHSKFRKDLFRPGMGFAYEIVLTSRPKWDWWYEKDPWEKRQAPMHNFSWFVWSPKWEGPSTQYWAGPEDVGEPLTEDEDDGSESDDTAI